MSIDTSSDAHKMACLARQVIADCRNTADMKRWFDRWEARHGQAARAELRAAVVAEKDRQKAGSDLLGDSVAPEPLSDHEQHKADLLANRESMTVLAADDIPTALAAKRSA